jgi:hypothetical protein
LFANICQLNIELRLKTNPALGRIKLNRNVSSKIFAGRKENHG